MSGYNPATMQEIEPMEEKQSSIFWTTYKEVLSGIFNTRFGAFVAAILTIVAVLGISEVVLVEVARHLLHR